MRSSGRRRDEEGRCKEAEKGGGRGLNGTKGGEERGRGGRNEKKKEKIRKKGKRCERWKSGSVQGVRAMTGARFVNAHVILHAIYPSGTFSAEKACFSLKIKNLTNQTCFFVFFLFPSFFSISILFSFVFSFRREKEILSV